MWLDRIIEATESVDEVSIFALGKIHECPAKHIKCHANLGNKENLKNLFDFTIMSMTKFLEFITFRCETIDSKQFSQTFAN